MIDALLFYALKKILKKCLNLQSLMEIIKEHIYLAQLVRKEPNFLIFIYLHRKNGFVLYPILSFRFRSSINFFKSHIMF